jgi:hypothetical protein
MIKAGSRQASRKFFESKTGSRRNGDRRAGMKVKLKAQKFSKAEK